MVRIWKEYSEKALVDKLHQAPVNFLRFSLCSTAVSKSTVTSITTVLLAP